MSKEKDVARGYSIDLKRVMLAYLAETVIVLASLAGAWLFAVQYGHNDRDTMMMMMLAPIAYAVVEFCRVPLAISIRTQTSFFLRAILILGLIGAACVTVKSMSQLGEIMYRPRLYDVVRAKEQLTDAQSAARNIDQKIADADAIVTQRVNELGAADDQLKLATDRLGKLPEQKCLPISGVSRDGRAWRSMKCSADTRITPLVTGVKDATTTRRFVSGLLDKARADRAVFDRTVTDAKLREAEITYREAVMNSQLHSFAAMVFWKNPTDVTDREIHIFLFFFVFIAAIGSAFAATLVALSSVKRIKPEPPPVYLEDDAAQYILGPYAAEVTRQAAEAATRATQDTIRGGRPMMQTPRPPRPAPAAEKVV